MAANIKEIPYVYRTLFGEPLDIRTVVSSISNLLTEIPLALRYEGLIVYVQDKHEPYIFKGGVNDVNFVPLVTGTQTNSIAHMSRSAKQVYEDKIYIDTNNFIYKHDKGIPEDVILSEFVTGEQIDADIRIYENEIHIQSRLRGFFTLTLTF